MQGGDSDRIRSTTRRGGRTGALEWVKRRFDTGCAGLALALEDPAARGVPLYYDRELRETKDSALAIFRLTPYQLTQLLVDGIDNMLYVLSVMCTEPTSPCGRVELDDKAGEVRIRGTVEPRITPVAAATSYAAMAARLASHAARHASMFGIVAARLGARAGDAGAGAAAVAQLRGYCVGIWYRSICEDNIGPQVIRHACADRGIVVCTEKPEQVAVRQVMDLSSTVELGGRVVVIVNGVVAPFVKPRRGPTILERSLLSFARDEALFIHTPMTDSEGGRGRTDSDCGRIHAWADAKTEEPGAVGRPRIASAASRVAGVLDAAAADARRAAADATAARARSDLEMLLEAEKLLESARVRVGDGKGAAKATIRRARRNRAIGRQLRKLTERLEKMHKDQRYLSNLYGKQGYENRVARLRRFIDEKTRTLARREAEVRVGGASSQPPTVVSPEV